MLYVRKYYNNQHTNAVHKDLIKMNWGIAAINIYGKLFNIILFPSNFYIPEYFEIKTITGEK